MVDTNETDDAQDPYITMPIRQAAVDTVPLGPSRTAAYLAYVTGGIGAVQEGMATTVHALARKITRHRRQGRRAGRQDAWDALEAVAATRGAAAATVIRSAIVDAKASLLGQAITANPT